MPSALLMNSVVIPAALAWRAMPAMSPPLDRGICQIHMPLPRSAACTDVPLGAGSVVVPPPVTGEAGPVDGVGVAMGDGVVPPVTPLPTIDR